MNTHRTRSPAKLVKRRPVGSPSPERRVPYPSNPEELPPVPALNQEEASTMPSNTQDKEKKSKWRNPFHSKDKDKERKRDSANDSAYASSEPNNESAEFDSSGVPSFSSTELQRNRPVSGEMRRESRDQLRPPPTTLQGPQTNITPPTPPVINTHNQQNQQNPQNPVFMNPQRSTENISRESHQDPFTGNMVTTVTTTTTTTTTVTGPGGSITTQMPNGQAGNDPAQSHVTQSSGPNPPAPVNSNPVNQQNPPQMHQNPNYPNNQNTQRTNNSPPLPNKSSMRDRVELDSTGPSVQQPPPIASPVSPSSPNRANFSYPARTPPPGVPKHVPAQETNQYFPPNQDGRQSAYPGQPTYQSQPQDYPAALNPQAARQQAHGSQRLRNSETLANLKTAAAGIHGAGETLRGTLNSNIDRRFNKVDNPVHARNQAIIEAGRSEIETGHLAHYHDVPAQKHAQRPSEPLGNSTTVSAGTAPGNQAKSGGRLGSLANKIAHGPMASDRQRERQALAQEGRLRVVNE